MTDTYIDNDSRAAYTVDGNRFPPNLDNRNGADAGSDVFSQIGVSMMNAFIQTMLGTQHLCGNNASEIAQKAYAMAFNQTKGPVQQSLSFSQWAEEYMEVYETGCTDETRRKLYLYVRKHLIPFFGDMDITKITQTDVQRFANYKAAEVSEFTRKPYSHKTLKHLIGLMKKIMDRAMIAGHIQRNPVMKIKNNAVNPPRRKGSTEAAQGTMISLLPQIENPMVRLWATISLSSGMRAQEIAALKWEDVHWDEGFFEVTEAISWHNNRPIVKSTKTEAGQRRIPFQDWAIPLMRPLAEPSGYILRQHRNNTEGMQPISASAYRRLADEFETIIAQYGLPRYTAHIGRHTMANTLDKVGASSKSIELISGHTDADFTREQYMNAEFEQTRRDMQKVSEFNKNLLQQSDALYQKNLTNTPVRSNVFAK